MGECITGAGGDGGPLGIFLFVLKLMMKSSEFCFNKKQKLKEAINRTRFNIDHMNRYYT